MLSLDRSSPEPLYRQLAAHLRAAIRSGELSVGATLPPERELAERFGVNRATVLGAYRELKAEGLLVARVGSGTWVAGGGPEGDEGGGLPWRALLRADAAGDGDPLLRDLLALSERTDVLSLAVGLPAPDLLPLDALRAAQARVLEEHGPAALLHCPTEGVTALRETIAGLMAGRGAACPPEQILVTSGSQQALDLLARVMIEPGDAVVVEEPSFFGALQVFRRAGARLLGVPCDGDGLRPDALEAVLVRHRPRLVYTLPTFQNPSGAVLAPERRRALLALAARHRVPVVEDDPYGELAYDGPPVPPLRSLEGGGEVIYLSSFSKVLFPGLRIGWVAAPAPVARALALAKQTLDLHSGTLAQLLIDRLVRDGEFAAHLVRTRRAYASRRDAMETALRAGAPAGLGWIRPRGGYYFWCRVDAPVSPARLLAAAAERGVAFLPGAACYAGEPDDRHLRLNFTHPTPRQIRDGVARLLDALREALAHPDVARRVPGGTPPIV